MNFFEPSLPLLEGFEVALELCKMLVPDIENPCEKALTGFRRSPWWTWLDISGAG